jgi:hypothetical protein
MSTDRELTPGGCYRDNYRAIRTAGSTSALPSHGFLQFMDGSIYEVWPTSQTEWNRKVMQSEDPGCWFNKVLRCRPDYGALKLDSWPVFLDSEQTW